MKTETFEFVADVLQDCLEKIVKAGASYDTVNMVVQAYGKNASDYVSRLQSEGDG